LVSAGTVVSIGFALVLVRAAAAFLPQRSAGGTENRADVPATNHPQPIASGADIAAGTQGSLGS
jgi:hypothetical protein